MKNVLVLGAGLSASSLLRYLLQHAEENDWFLHVVDQSLSLVQDKLGNSSFAKAYDFNALDSDIRREHIKTADLVISMLPARFHIDVAKDCVDLGVHLLTPSYISPEMKELDAAAKEKGILIMNEMGVDPGIDHMSAMKIIHEIEEKGGELTSFKSFCGGLIAPENDNNPLNYKFTWNPRNVVLAGQGGASCFIQNGEYKYIPYHRLFTRTEVMSVDGYGDFEGYANRDSLKYRSIYGLDDIPTIYRGTLRRPGYCEFWNALIQLGLTDDSYKMTNIKEMSPRKFLNAFLPYDKEKRVEEKLTLLLQNPILYKKFEWLDFFNDDIRFEKPEASPAEMLQEILVRKLTLDPDDKDMLVMHHEFEYTLGEKAYKVTSQMVNIGEDKTYTSMSNTVGLPLAICAKMILNDEIQERGVQMPIVPDIYMPILEELDELGISFVEKEVEIKH
ncbi:MAG: saccharopine dehydrogenase NADP-binding domain-containing protein [Crocinitomicaceae bacterium]|jgi:saccharopine dehydrogenase-like NADP-dependent oxidoreductase|nr:saccharopine dehydrogenase NADP-binding domain-containing protein [Crocinitomicaceae bacterium]